MDWANQPLGFAFSPISTASRASLSALRRLWFAWNSGSAWLSDIVCLDESGWRARRSSSSATCCSADRFGLIICVFPSAPALQAGGWLCIGDRIALSPDGVSLTVARCFSPRLSIPVRGVLAANAIQKLEDYRPQLCDGELGPPSSGRALGAWTGSQGRPPTRGIVPLCPGSLLSLVHLHRPNGSLRSFHRRSVPR